MITIEGKKLIRRVFAGQPGNIAGYIAVGTGNSNPLVTDKQLQFEFVRTNVVLSAPDFANSANVYKAILPQSVVGKISEVGLFSTNQNNGLNPSKSLFVFDDVEQWSGGVFTSNPERIGGQTLTMSAAASTTTTASLTDLNLDLTAYRSSDRLSFAFNIISNNILSLKLRLLTDISNYYEYTTNTFSSNYQIVSFAKSEMSIIGNPDWGNITRADVILSANGGGTTTIELDALRIINELALQDTILVSRTVLGSPIVKSALAPLEIEYRLGLQI